MPTGISYSSVIRHRGKQLWNRTHILCSDCHNHWPPGREETFEIKTSMLTPKDNPDNHSSCSCQELLTASQIPGAILAAA